MVSTSRWRIGSIKRSYDGIYSELYVILTIYFLGTENHLIRTLHFCITTDSFRINFCCCCFADKVKNAANITLLALMLLAIYNHWMVNDAFERIGSALVFTFMLTGRLVVWYQISRREAKINAATQAQANGLKQD